MPFNGSGVFTLVTGNPVVTGTTVSSTWANNSFSDFATGLSTAITKDGQTTPTANIPFGGFKATGAGAATTNGDLVRYEQVGALALTQGVAASGANSDIKSLGNNSSTIYTTAGTSTAYTITPAPVYAAYAAGMSFVVNFNAACGGAPTLAINGIATPPNLVKRNSDGTFSNLAAGDLPINHRSRVTLVSTTQAWVESLPNALTTATAVATTSGTSIDFTGIPSWVKRVTLLFSGVSTSGTANWLVRIGDGAIVTTGYISTSIRCNNGSLPDGQNNTLGFVIDVASAGSIVSGTLTLIQIATNVWVQSHCMGDTTFASSYTGGGSKTLSGTLDRLRLTTSGGADTFDAGSINIIYE